MAKRHIGPAVAGFLVGAATLAGGQGDAGLREKLRELQEAAARVLQQGVEVEDVPARDGRGNELAFLPIADLVTAIPQHLPPEHRLRAHREIPIFGSLAEEAPQPFGTGEEIMELVRGLVQPMAWETGSINLQGSRLIVLNRPDVLRDITRMLDGELRPRAHRCVTIEAEVADAPVGAGLDGAERVFAARGTALVGQRFLVWHGRQVALLSDAEVEVAQEASVADPIIEVVQAGGSLSVRADVGDDTSHLALDVEFQHDRLLETRRRDTTQAGVLDMPSVESDVCRTTLTVAQGDWTVLATGVPRDNRVRVLRIRATYLPRTGGAQ